MTTTSLNERPPRYYTPDRVAAWVGVTSMSIIRWCDAGTLEAVTTPGGHRRIKESSVLEYLHGRGLMVPTEMAPTRPSDAPCVVVVSRDARTLTALTNHLKESADVVALSDDYRAVVEICTKAPRAVVIRAVGGLDAAQLIRALEGDRSTPT